jgi:hypothetical protein
MIFPSHDGILYPAPFPDTVITERHPKFILGWRLRGRQIVSKHAARCLAPH